MGGFFKWLAFVVVGLSCTSAFAAHKWGLQEGAPDLKSAGQLAFGPDGVLFVGDSKGGAVFAIDTADTQDASAKPAHNIDKLSDALSELFSGAKVNVNDMAVNPISSNVYLSTSSGDEAKPALVKVDAANKLHKVPLEKVYFLKAQLSSVPEDKGGRSRRNEAITAMAYVEGRLLISGLTNDASPSSVRELSFPFSSSDQGTSVEIYHGAHGRVEDGAPIRTFIPMNINGKPSLLAGYTCTPLVRFDLDGLKPGKKSRGTTVAELGNMNTPIDMIAYEKGGQKYLLMANTARGVMKINTDEIGREEGITAPVKGGGTAGQTYEKIKDLEGTVQLDRLGADQAVVLVMKDKALTMKTVPLP